jgi:hypothetical protein
LIKGADKGADISADPQLLTIGGWLDLSHRTGSSRFRPLHIGCTAPAQLMHESRYASLPSARENSKVFEFTNVFASEDLGTSTHAVDRKAKKGRGIGS